MILLIKLNLNYKFNYICLLFQGIDFIESALTSVIGSNETASKNIDMALNICASELLDYVWIIFFKNFLKRKINKKNNNNNTINKIGKR